MSVLRGFILGSAALLALGFGVVFAQAYPQPSGNVTVIADPNPPAGGSISVTIVVADDEGVPVSGRSCTASVGPQPGSGASVSPSSFTTGADGRATFTLQTGDTAGDVVVETVCGDLQAQTLFRVGTVLLPPDTGTGGGSAGGTLPLGQLAGAVAAALLLTSVATVAVARRR